MVVRLRKAVRHLAGRETGLAEPSGEQNEASWRQMLERIDAEERDRELTLRLARTEQALARLNLN